MKIVWIDEYLEHEKLRGLILDGDSDIIVVSCPECGGAQSCPVDDFDIDEFEFFHLVDHCPNDPDHDPDRRHEWASVWDGDDLWDFTLEVFVPRQEARITIRRGPNQEGERIASPDADHLAHFIARVIVPALLTRLRQQREHPPTLRVFVRLEWTRTWNIGARR